MTTILVAADAQWVRDQVRAAFMGPGQEVVEATRGQDVRDMFAEVDPDLVVLDMQIGNMGGIAVALDLRLEESGGRLDRANILLLLDREADEFIARRADVDMILVKPVDAGVLRRAAKGLLSRVVNDHEVAAKVAYDAGQLLLELRARGGSKDDGDRESNEFILAALGRDRPDDAILSEESKDDLVRLERARVWIVDPLDGTREFGEAGRSDWAVHVALVVNGIPDACAVALPAQGEVLATPNVSLAPATGGRMRILVSRTRPPKLAEYLAEVLDAELVPLGSAGAKTMAVVQGHADVYAHSGGQYEWDSAAPVGVASAAGCHCSRLDGAPLVYNQPDSYLPDLLVCRPELAERVLATVANAPDR